MQSLTKTIESKYMKNAVVDVRSGDTVRVHQKIKEGSKERVQIFEGLVINTKRTQSHSSTITVRRMSSGVGVEKTFLLHSPLVEKVEVVKRSKVRRNNLTYMRSRSGKSARLDSVGFDKSAVNDLPVEDEPAIPADDAPAIEEAQEEALTEESSNEEVEETKEEVTSEK